MGHCCGDGWTFKWCWMRRWVVRSCMSGSKLKEDNLNGEYRAVIEKA